MATKPLTQKKRIGELLIEAEIITQVQLDEALSAQKQNGGKVVELLINLGYLDHGKVAQFLASQPGVPSIDLTKYRVAPEVVSLIPRDFAVKNEVFPIDKMGKLLTVGMAFPLDVTTIKRLEELTGLRVKALLCNPADIRHAIDNYYKSPTPVAFTVGEHIAQISSGVRVESIASLIRQIDALPTLPQTVQRVQEVAASAEMSMKEIARVVSLDPAISGKLLKLANSAAYGFTHRVDNVYLATSLLGLRETVMAVTSSAVISLTEQAANFDHEAYWRRSTMCATAAKRVGAACELKATAGLFTAGLLCEIGRFALWKASPDRYGRIPTNLSDREVHAAEEKAFGIAHTEAGYLLAEHWGLPPELAEPIRYHLNPDQSAVCPELTGVVALAARCVDAIIRGEAAAPTLFAGFETSLQRLGVDADELLGVFDSLKRE